MYVPFSVRHKTPPFLIRVWDYPNKQKSASGYSLAVLAIVTPSYLLTLPLLHLGGGEMAGFSQKEDKKKDATDFENLLRRVHSNVIRLSFRFQ